jgi:ATP-dependent helicase/nuclease subunit B
VSHQGRLEFDEPPAGPSSVATAAVPQPAPTTPPCHPFLRQLATLCRSAVTRTKWVVVPSHHVGHALGESLVLGGTNWLNLRFVTPLDLAVRTAAPLLIDRGIDPSEESLGPALVMRLLGQVRGRYFGPIAHQTSLSAALWSTLRELRFAGLRARDLPPTAFASAAKHAEIVALLGAYERHLEQHRLADMAAVFEQAPHDLRFCPVRADDLVLECPDVPVPPVVRRFLDGLPGERQVPETMSVPNLEPSASWTARSAPARRHGASELLAAAGGPSGVTRDAARLVYLREPSAAGPAHGDGSLDIFHAGGVEAELDEIYRRVLASGRGLDAVEVVCAAAEVAHLAWEKAVTLGWPVTIACGLPATQSRPGRALLGWVGWLRNRLSAAELRRLLESGDLAPREWSTAGEASEAALSSGAAARVLQRAGATWGRGTYATTLSALAEDSERRAERAGIEADQRASHARRASRARRLQAWIAGLLAAVPEPDGDGSVGLAQVLAAARQFLASCAAVHNPLDRAAAEGIATALASLSVLDAHRCAFEEALGFILDAVEQTTIGCDRARPRHLHVSLIGATSYVTRPLVFLAGLEEARVFPALVEDPVLLDEEREALSAACDLRAGLPGSADRLRDAVHRGVLQVATAGLTAERVTFSFSCRETREFRDTFPSWVVLQAHRLRASAPHDTYRHLSRALGEPASSVPSMSAPAASTAQWWLAGVRAGERARQAVRSAYPALALAADAQAARDALVFGEHDGFAPQAAPVLDPAGPERVLSATTLETAAACPFRYFLRYGLGLEVVEESEPDPDVWLDSLTRGSALHEMYAGVLRRARAQGRRVAVTPDLEWARADAAARLDALARDLPPPSVEVAARERDEFLADVEAFVREEAEEHAVSGEAFEVSFGIPITAADDPLASGEVVEVPIEEGRVLRLRGRIDRLDQVAPDAYQVVDYKTGGFWPDGWKGVFAGGTRLQHALYALAGDELLRRAGRRGRVVRALYRFPTARGRGQRVEIPRPPDEAIRTVLHTIAEVLRTGTFLQARDEDTCRFCTFTGACGCEPWVRGRAKLDANAGGPLARLAQLEDVP